jgi:hypothetical protein
MTKKTVPGTVFFVIKEKSAVAGIFRVDIQFPGGDSAAHHLSGNARQGYEKVKKLDADKNHLVWLTPAPANNTWTIASLRSINSAEAASLKVPPFFSQALRSASEVS